ncbi:Minor tail protein [Shewanella sp. phage 3/49]|uniref:minor tail protein n=1 Tax=Shewanella sp. phage 3/49 TaxID=1458863 RepID=UPI0004F5CAD2|nr:minor tail protein [Shewanella sp. phage 3/49]AHK11831.1 Minor tail protein [Shewanella sp. phage 3/49]
MTAETVKAAYRKKLASNPDGEIAVGTWEIYHPLMSKRYYFVSDQVALTAFLENGTEVTFEPANISTKGAANNADMSQSATMTIADPFNELDSELDRIPLENETLPLLTFRIYLISDLSHPAWGPVEYEAQDINQGKGAFTATVSAPRINNKGTGLIVTPTLCPLLRGLLA